MNKIPLFITLEMAVVSTHLTQPLDSPSIMVKTLITNKVTAIFTMTLGKPIAYVMHALPTAVSRIMKISLFLFFLVAFPFIPAEAVDSAVESAHLTQPIRHLQQ
jgi:hypothetical protein